MGVAVLRRKEEVLEEEVRWLIIKSMLEEFPRLRDRVKRYLKRKDP